MTRRPPAGAPSPRARALGLAVAAVVALLLAVPTALAPGLPGWGGTGATPAEAATTPAALQLTTISPDVPTAGSVLRVTGEITNTGRQVLRDVEVRLRLSATRLGSRAELAAVAEGRTTSRDGEPIVSATLPDLDPGESTTFAVSRALDEIPQLTGFGVYVLGVEVLAGRPSGFGRVALVRTLLPWVPEQPDFLPTGYTWLWPLVSRPTRLSNGTFSDDVLAGEMAADGRLSRLLDAGSRIQDSAALTWVVDPELLSAAADMADGYRVQAPDGSTVPGGGSGIAGLWLDRLRTATAEKPVLAVPYADPDLVALNRHGRAGDIVQADASAAATLADTLPLASAVSDIAWPVDGFVNRSTLGVLRGDGRTAAVLDGRAVPPEIDLSYTPGGRADLATRSGKVAGLLADPGLADQLRRHGPDPLLAGQRFLAETAMITSELPSTGTERSIVVMPPRRWDPEQAFLDRLVASADAPWTA